MDKFEAELLQLTRVDRDTGTIRFLCGGTRSRDEFPTALERLRERGWISRSPSDKWLITEAGLVALADEENWQLLAREVVPARDPLEATQVVVGEVQRGNVIIVDDFFIRRGGIVSGGGTVLSVIRDAEPSRIVATVYADSLEPGDLLTGKMGRYAEKPLPEHLTPLEYLTDWYTGMCNDDWEHAFGIRIETLDNPGWTLTVDLVETNLDGAVLPEEKIERSDSDWISVRSDGSTFGATGGTKNLQEMLQRFREFSVRHGRFRGRSA